ncbi:DUF5107 domain-containing protein [Paenibacillus psychroresistens]|nr:DUF5107 domain-containing protein [Paenibacillus psychroresistens]
MKVRMSSLTIEGALIEGENPLPMFRSRDHHREVFVNENYVDEHKLNLGNDTGERYLPYRMQDRYSRAREMLELKTVVLENDHLQAVFLPDYGGRLYSLKDKRTNREILYKNPVFQPANLAILNAWFSGGIEWNIGHLGHTYTTCSPLHAAKLVDDEGNEFLRMYEYERCKNIFWQLDFHLPQGSEQLLLYVRIVNDNNHAVPMYWWTNIAVEETTESRVFSDTKDVIYHDPELKGFGTGQLPYLSSVPDTDVSYPMRFPYSNEYFFQTAESCKSPWEAIVYEDGRVFYERSTALLRYRKMFCWGNHQGGRRWCDFLAKPGEGNYIELQGGFAPTQLHGLEMPAHTIWDFTQIFGVSVVDTKLAYDESWDQAQGYVAAHLNEKLDEAEVYASHNKLQAYADKLPESILHKGSGWGELERIRREQAGERDIPQGILFTDESLGAEQLPWIALMQEGSLPESAVGDIPASWMVQKEWTRLLQMSLKNPDNQNWAAYMHYGVMLYEQELEAEAVDAWETSIKLQPSTWVYRNLAEVMKQRGQREEALACLEQAYNLTNGFPDRAFAEEYLNLIMLGKDYSKAWEVYESLSVQDARCDRIQIIVGKAALELGKYEFVNSLFNKEFAVIREGEVLIIELWFSYQARKLAESRNTSVTQQLIEEAKVMFPPPVNIDFRMVGA